VKKLLILILLLLAVNVYGDIDVTGKFVPKNDGFTGLVDGDQVLDEATTANNIPISDGTSYQSTAPDAGTDITADLEEETHASEHAVSGADTVFPADPNADKYLMWDDDPGQLSWEDAGGGGSDSGLIESTLTNKSGANTVVGYVYRLDPDNAESFDYASEDEDEQVCVAQEAGIADGSTTSVAMGGVCEVYLKAGESADISTSYKYLYFSDTSGQAKVSNFRSDGCFGIALEDGGNGSAITCLVFRQPMRRYASFDQDSWTRCIAVPILYDYNSFDSDAALWDNASYDYLYPCAVSPDGKGQIVHMFLGRQTQGKSPIEFDIWKAVSTDGGDTFAAESLVFDISTYHTIAGADWMATHSVLINEVTGDYEMWYFTYDLGARQVWYTSSSDEGDTWAAPTQVTLKAGGNLTDCNASMAVMRLGTTYFIAMRNSAASAIDIYESDDPHVWSKLLDNAIVDSSAGYGSLYHASGVIYCYYSVKPGALWYMKQASTTIANRVVSWNIYPIDFMLTANHIVSSSLHQNQDTYHFYYGEYTTRWRINHAKWSLNKP